MKPQATVSIDLIRFLSKAAALFDVDVKEYLAGLHIDPALLDSLDARVPHEVIVHAWTDLARRAGDDNIGLRIADRARRVPGDALDYAIRNSATLRECIEKMLRYWRILHTAGSGGLEIGAGVARLFHRPRLRQLSPPRHAAEFMLANTVACGRAYTGVAWSPIEVWFKHPAPASTGEHERFFRAPVRFEMPENQLLFDAALLDLPLPTADSILGAVLDRHVSELLAKLPADEDLPSRVRKEIVEAMQGRVPDVQHVAKRLGLSPRTLHRRLQEHGTTYQDLLDESRRDLAFAHLRRPGVSVSEVAFLLGFSEASAFHRAFRRWTGRTPVEHRREHA